MTRAPDPVAVLLAARLSGRALPTFPAPVPTTLADAYAMQRQLVAALGATVLGWKVGRIPPALVDTLGTDRIAGPVFRITELNGCAPGDAPVFVGGAGAIEAEVMLHLRDVPDRPAVWDSEGTGCVDEIRAGFEIASSPAPDVHGHAPYGIIADIGINNGLLLGPRLDRPDFAAIMVETRVGEKVVGTGRPNEVLDGPWGSLNFLIDLHRRGLIRLEPGQWISAGAITGVHPIAIGQVATARFGADAQIACTAIAENGFRP